MIQTKGIHIALYSELTQTEVVLIRQGEVQDWVRYTLRNTECRIWVNTDWSSRVSCICTIHIENSERLNLQISTDFRLLLNNDMWYTHFIYIFYYFIRIQWNWISNMCHVFFLCLPVLILTCPLNFGFKLFLKMQFRNFRQLFAEKQFRIFEYRIKYILIDLFLYHSKKYRKKWILENKILTFSKKFKLEPLNSLL